MAFIKTIPEDQADGLVLNQYKTAQESSGYVPNYVQAFSIRPEVYGAWSQLIGAIRSKMRLRRYELVTFAAAMELRCTYCMLAHGSVLRKNFFTPDQITAIVKDFHQAGLTAEEVALMDLAQKIIRQAHAVSEADVEEIRGFGLSDEEILDVVLAVTARSFFSKTLDALAAVPDEVYRDLEPELLQVLVGGRPFPA